MATRAMEIEVSFAWWVPVYINVLACLCGIMRSEPDIEKVERVMERGIRLKAVYK